MNISRTAVIAASFALCAITSATHGQLTTDETKALRPTTAVFIHADVARIQLPKWLTEAESGSTLLRLLELLKKASGPQSTCYATVDLTFTGTQPALRILVPAETESDVRRAKSQLQRLSPSEPIQQDGFVVATPLNPTPQETLQVDSSTLTINRESFIAAKNAVSDWPLKLTVVPPPYLLETYNELLPTIPKRLGGGPISILTEGVEWVAFGIDPKATRLEGTIKSQSSEAAERLARRIPSLVKATLSQLPDPYANTIGAQLTGLIDRLQLKVQNDKIHLSLASEDERRLATALPEILGMIDTPMAHGRKQNLMRQIVLGILNYESAFAAFPPAEQSRGDDGTSGLSWRVHILPYIEEIELYQQFKLDEPWDSNHNLKLLDKMPVVYSTYSRSRLADPIVKRGYTTFLAPTGDGTILDRRKVTKVRDVRDGLSKTVILVEVAPSQAVPWTAPRDYEFSPDNPGAGLGWDRENNVGVCFSDGAWRLLSQKTARHILRKLFLMDDGHTVNMDAL